MKTAIDCYARGKQREANADEYPMERYYPQGRFICPECGEEVHLARSKYSNHFSHYKKTDISVQCDLRVDGTPTQSVYERIGLPMYLRKDDNGDFRLFMGFRALPMNVLEEAEKHRLSFKIIGTEQQYRITRERFILGETTLIPIVHIPFSGVKYRLKYEPIGCSADVLSYWSDEADGFSYDGALFSVTSLGGKKIRHGDTVSTGVEYYWVRKTEYLPSFVSGIKMNRVGNLILKDHKYTVFQGTFDSSINDVEFSSLTAYLRRSLKLHLLEKQPEFIPVWPPCLKTENGYIAKRSGYIYGRIESGNDDPKVYVYHGNSAMPEKANQKDGFAKVLIAATDTYISIDRKYVSSGTYILKNEFQISEKTISLKLNHEMKMRGYERLKLQSSKDLIEIKLPYEFDYLYAKSIGEYVYKKRINEILLENIAEQDRLFIMSNQTEYFVIDFFVDRKVEKRNEPSKEFLLKMIKFYSNAKKVKIPYLYRVKLYKQYKDSAEIMNLLKQDEIPFPVLNIMEEL